MKKHLRHWAIAAAGFASAIAFSSCAYDPYYSSVGGSYSTGYGEGYGYGGSNFSTSVFVSTGNPRWGYDPYCYSYYDYSRRCYYDPYLHGYYPIGYRPPVIVGCPHPYGYRRGYCPPPSYVSNVTVVNYRDREGAYRSSNYGWAKQVRRYPGYQNGAVDSHNSRNPSNHNQGPFTKPNYVTGGYSRQNSNRSNYTKPNYDSRSGGMSRQNEYRNNYSQGGKTNNRKEQGARMPSGYNTPVNRQDQYSQPKGNKKNQSQQFTRPNNTGGKHGGNRQAQPNPNGGGKKGRQEEKNGFRGLGQG